ncbi:MAG: T9SS type A sorting domain-containing protein [Ignavibacteriae bacterium]|nr:T9SS type A sorting domain-containing protein [Ignavibacteriota bacterium]
MLKIKSIFTIIFLTFTSFHYSQIENALISDFRVSKDELFSSFKQANPNLFSNSSKEFIVAWEDYRLGDLNYFAQRFDSLGNKIGSNFKVNSNFDIVLDAEDGFLNISNEYYENFFDVGNRSVYASIFNSNNEIIKDEFLLGNITLPWCGTGYLGYGFKTIKSENGFTFGIRDNGKLDLIYLDELGNITSNYHFSDSTNATSLINFDICSLSNKTILTWINYNTWEQIPDSIEINSSILDNLKNSRINIKVKKTDQNIEQYLYNNSELFKNVSLTDSTFLIFDLINGPFELSFRKFDLDGKKLTNDTLIKLNENFDSNFTYSIRSFNVSSMRDNKFAVNISYDSGAVNLYNFILIFNKNGELLKIYSEKSVVQNGINERIFMLSDNEFLSAKFIDDDIYLIKKNVFIETERIKINDDISGSNETNPQITAINENKFFVAWSNERNFYGQKISQNGIIEESEIILEGNEVVFLENSTLVNLWKDRISGDQLQLGFSIYNSNNELIRKDTIQICNYYNYSENLIKLTDTTFCIISGSESTKLTSYNNFGELVKEIGLPNFQYPNPKKLYIEGKNLWVKWGNNLQLFQNNLEPISSIYVNDFNEYIGSNKFLSFYSNFNNYGYDLKGTIKSHYGDTLVSNIDFSDIPYLEYYNGNVSVVPLLNSKFLVLYSLNSLDGGQYSYYRVYTHEGKIEYAKQIIHQKSVFSTKNSNALISNNKVFFVWSDLRERNIGYDIYCNIYNLNVITEVEDPQDNYIKNEFELMQNYPNPFNPITTIKYNIPIYAKSENQNVKLIVYDILGKEVKILVNEKKNSGNYEIQFDGSNLASGIYFYKLSYGKYSSTKKFVLMK